MRILRKIAQEFNKCGTALASAILGLCMAALIFSPLSAQAETASLQRDNNGNITQRTISPTQATTTYTYDQLNRIKSEAGSAKSQLFDYDEDGNRKSDGAGSYTYETTSNRMATRLGVAVTYDAAGNLTADGTGKTFTYNQAGQLYQVKQSGTLLATYTYDGNGLRTRKVTTASAPQSAMTVIYIYDQWGKIMEEYTGTGTLIRSYIWRDDTPVAQIEHTTGGDKILYFEVDHLNTPRAAMDETGKVVWRWESDAFGSSLPDEDPDKDGVKVTVNLRFPGQYADIESGLNYNWHRYYDPKGGGRYTSSDPIGLSGGSLSTYSYANQNPVRYIDPYGLYCFSDAKINGIAGGIGGALGTAVTLGIAGFEGGGVPGAVAGAIGGAVVGGFVGAATGYVGTGASDGRALGLGMGSGLAGGINTPAGGTVGGAVGAASTSALSAAGVPNNISGIAGGGIGGTVGGFASGWLGNAALNGAKTGGAIGTASAALSAAIAAALSAGNDCGCGK